jgi:hypothetical protein
MDTFTGSPPPSTARKAVPGRARPPPAPAPATRRRPTVRPARGRRARRPRIRSPTGPRRGCAARREPGPGLGRGPAHCASGSWRRVWPGKCCQVQLEVEHEQLPAADHVVVLVVPLPALAEPAVDQSHHAGAAAAGLDQPLERQPADPSPPSNTIRCGGSQTATRPGPASRDRARTTRRPCRLRALDRVGDVPRTRCRGRWRPPATPPRRAGDLDLRLDGTAISTISHTFRAVRVTRARSGR